MVRNIIVNLELTIANIKSCVLYVTDASNHCKTYGERSKNMVVGHVSNDATINIHTRDNRPNVNANYVRFVRSMCTTIQNTATQNTSQSHQNLQDGNHILFFNGFCQYKKNTQKCFFSGILESKRKVGPPPSLFDF